MDPTQMPPQLPPTPIPPTQPGGVPAMPPGGDQVVSPEQKQALMDLIARVREKLTSVNAVQFASDNKTDNLRRELLKQVFEKLQLAGVDLTDRQSVADFMAKLQQNNPELAQMFEKAMEVLLGGTPPITPGVPQDPSALGVPPAAPENNMNNIIPNETVPQNIP